VLHQGLPTVLQEHSHYLLHPYLHFLCHVACACVTACCCCLRPGATTCSAQLDTPLHTATLLSMLKMVQQLAAAEAELQEQQSAQHSPPAPHSQQSGPQGSQACDKQPEQCSVQALQAAHTLLSPSAAVLRRARTMWGRVQLALCSAQVQDVSSDLELQLELPWPCGEVGAGLGGFLEEANQQRSVFSVMATLDGQVRGWLADYRPGVALGLSQCVAGACWLLCMAARTSYTLGEQHGQCLGLICVSLDLILAPFCYKVESCGCGAGRTQPHRQWLI
jgi:hypothetical protein